MRFMTSLNIADYKKTISIAFILTILFPLLIMIYFIVQYIMPSLALVQRTALGIIFGYCLSAMFLVSLLGYLLIIQVLNASARTRILEEETITDPLMKIYNRRYMDKRLIEEISRAQRYELPLSVFLIDIDHFKQINDNYGHQVGDDVLKGLGKLIPETLRENDIVARYGGEEIFVILPNTSDSDAIIVAERLRHTVESTALIKDNKRCRDNQKGEY